MNMQMCFWGLLIALFLPLTVPLIASGQTDFTRQLMSVEHYEVRETKKVKIRKPAAAAVAAAETTAADPKTSPEVQASSKVSTATTHSATPTSAVIQNDVKIEIPAAPAAPAAEPVVEPSLGEQAHSLLNGPDDKITEFYRERVHPEDIRNNKVEIQIRPGFVYTDSRSSYSYRTYQSAFDVVDVRSNVWFVPLIGLTGAMRFSLGGSIRGDSTTGSMDMVKDEQMELGLKFRHFFGLSRKSTALEFSVFYMDHSFNVSKDSISHPRTRSSGFGLSAQVQVPSSAEHAWIFGGKFAPRLQHQESATGISVESGSSAENILLGLELGGEWRLSRQNQFLYGVEMTSERNLFSGTASKVDPQSGATPSNVTVTDTRFNFFLGYRWGH